jgi:MscS family membrane protein
MNFQRVCIAILVLSLFLLAGCAPFRTAGRVQELATGMPLDTASEDLSGAIAERTPVPTPAPGRVEQALAELVGEGSIASDTFLGLTVSEWLNLLRAVLLVLLIYVVGRWLVRRPLHSLVRRTPTEFDDQFIRVIEEQLHALVVLVAIDVGVMQMGVLGENLRRLLEDLFFLLYLGLGVYIVWELINFTGDWYRTKVTDRIGEEQYEALVPLIKRLAFIMLFILAIVILMDHFGFNTTGVAIVVVLIAIVLYFGSRDFLRDAFIGFVILFDEPFRVGDRIEIIGMQLWGDVVAIGTRTTRILTRDNRLIVVPNSDIANSRVLNYTYPDPTLRFELTIGVQYDTDVVGIRRSIREAVGGADGVLSDKPVDVLFIEFSDRGLIFCVRWWVDTYTDPYPVYDKVNEAMYAALGREGIKVSFTTANIVHVTPKDGGYLQPQITGESNHRTSETSASARPRIDN